MARRKASASDLAELAGGKGSKRDRAEAGVGSYRSKTRGRGRNKRIVRKRGRSSN
jgi:hypothetical protein